MRKRFGIALVAIMTMIVVAGSASGQTVVKPGFNVFSVDQDVEIGKQSALQVAKQLPMVSDATASRYVSNLGARLAAQAPGAKFPYQFKIVNASDINAFALPGGFIYVNRGLLDKVRSEGELAGVMAHEIAHVALRHPTNQASKAYLAQAGLGILGGLLGGKSESSTGQIIGVVGGFGLNTLFLKFSRSAESQADIVGSQIMAKAGYDPMEMAHFFGYLAQQTKRRDREGIEQLAREANAVPILVWLKTDKKVALLRGQEREARSDSLPYSADKMQMLIDRFDKATDLPSENENVIFIDGEQPFEQQFESYQAQLQQFLVD